MSNDSPQLSERTYVTARIYPPGVRPGTPAGKKFMQSIAIDRYAADQVSRAPRMSREVREKVFTLLGSSPREMPPPKPEIRERPAYRLPERTTVDFETDEMLTPGRVGRRLGVSESVARLMIRRGVLGSVVVGQTRFVPMSEADRWKATGEAPPPEPTLRKARVASEQREKDRQSAITRARTELSAMQSGTWVRPALWDWVDEDNHHNALCRVLMSGDERYFDVAERQRELWDYARRSFWHCIRDACWAGAIRRKLLNGWAPKLGEGETVARAIAGAWVIAQHHEDDALKFDIIVGNQEIENEFRRAIGVPERWCWGCDEGHDEIREYWSTKLSSEMAGRRHLWQVHPTKWAQHLGDAIPMDPETESDSTPGQPTPKEWLASFMDKTAYSERFDRDVEAYLEMHGDR